MEELSKVVLEKENSKLIFEEKKDSLEINFFSVVDNPVFEISSENEDVYNSFKSFVSSINKGNKNLLDEETSQFKELEFNIFETAKNESNLIEYDENLDASEEVEDDVPDTDLIN